jgi:hypothetical protein
MQRTTDAIQPVIEQTRQICQTARAVARAKSPADEAEVVRLCEDLWTRWNDLAAVQRLIIEASQ